MKFKYKFWVTVGLVSVIAIIMPLFITKAKANPSYFLNVSSATATSSPTINYLSAGTGTTTVTFDALTGGNQAVDSASLLTQFTGSSTASTLNYSLEYSQDGIDWYSDTFGSATTSTVTLNTVRLDTPNSYSVAFASSTVGGAAGISTRTNRIINVNTPTRFVRAVYTIPAGSLAGSLYAQFVGKRETSN